MKNTNFKISNLTDLKQLLLTRTFQASLLILLAVPSVALSAQDTRVIMVSASGEKSADPDMVIVNLQIWGKGQTAKEAQSLNADMTQRVQKVFENFAIKKEDIVTEYFSVNPETVYDHKSRESRIVGFQTNHSLRTTLRKSVEAGQLLDALTALERNKNVGVNMNGIYWDYSKRSQLEVETLADAVQNTKLRATELAKAAGVQIKRVLSLSHQMGGGHGIPVRPMFRAKSMDMMSEMASGAAPETSLSSGQIKVRVEVSAEYEIQ